ncbi:hypothetical protein [Spirosoma gilvum]
MRTLCFFTSVWLILNAGVSLAQSIAQEPDYTVIITADGRPVDLKKGISTTTQTIQLQGSLTKESRQLFPQLKSDVLIEQVIISLVRGTRRVDYLNWTGVESLARLSKQAQAGDRYVMQFEEVSTQTRQGTSTKLSNNLIYAVPLY